jgi:electron transfer flavoprotein alpha subunit
MKILTFIQHDDSINNISLEALVGAQKLAQDTGGSVVAVTFSSDAISSLEKYDLAKILVANNPNLSEYNPLNFTSALEQIINSESPDIVLFGHTYEARDWLPRLSARLNRPLITDCIDCKNENGITLTRPLYQGKIYSDIKTDGGMVLVAFQPGTFKVDNLENGSAPNESIEVTFSDSNSITNSEKFQESSGGVDLTTADTIVTIGRGIGKEENIPMAEELATKMSAQLGASRPIVDANWIDHSRQVGSSGQTIAPNVYLGLGISGAIQHLVGIKGSKNIVAINKDENAPIFDIADYGVVGDIHEIIPKLIEKL